MKASTRLFFDSFDTPLGKLTLLADEAGRLRQLGWTDAHPRMQRELMQQTCEPAVVLERANPHGLSAAVQAYFDGDVSAIDGLPVEVDGTEFQRSVWRALSEIPCGVTWSYAELARRIGNPKAVRAVGLANGANPIAIVIPCHRVIGADGSLTGYGAGVERKAWLLAHETKQSKKFQVAARATPPARPSNPIHPQ